MSEEQKTAKAEEAKSKKVKEEKKEEEKKEKKPRLTFREKFDQNTTEEERVELAKRVAELRIDPDAERAAAWKTIRDHEDVCLSSDEFHKIIRPSDYYKEAILNRLKSLIDQGWVYNGNLTTLCGVDVPQELVEAMDANKAKAKAKAKPEEKKEEGKVKEEEGGDGDAGK